MPEWLLPSLTFIAGCATTYFLLRVRFERFEAMDTRREQDWTAWRREIDEWIAAKEKADYRWRHDEYSPRISEIQLNVRVLQTQMARVERTLNGQLK